MRRGRGSREKTNMVSFVVCPLSSFLQTAINFGEAIELSYETLSNCRNY